MDAKFCTTPGCELIAIGVSRWKPRFGDNPHPERPHNELCRPHLLEHVEPELVRCEVVGTHRIIDYRTLESVAKPGVVELDPAETNIAQLVGLGLVRVLPKAEAVVEAKPAKAGKGA